MRALAVDTDVIVVVSAVWQTTATFVRAGSPDGEEPGREGFLIDSPLLPDELDALPSLAEQAGFPVNGLLATHADWDHLLGRLAFPQAGLGMGEPSAKRLDEEVGGAQRRLRGFDDDWYVHRSQPLGLAGTQALPLPGRLSIGPDGRELELHPADGHTADGTAFWLPWLEVLVCGDYLSPVEIPMLSAGGSATTYLATLARLATLVDRAQTVVPGHGEPQGREAAQRILEEDAAYLEALVADQEPVLPQRRRTDAQRRIHAENVTRLSG